jgi:hypothetical protein
LRNRARPGRAHRVAGAHGPHATDSHHPVQHASLADRNTGSARLFQIRRRAGRLRGNPVALPGEPAGELGRLYRRQHFYFIERRASEAALRFQSAAFERRAHERRHWQFRGGGNWNAELFELLSWIES